METDWEHALTSLKVGSSGGRPAVHKPTLVLMLVARAQAGKSNAVTFSEVASTLEEVIQEFGPPTKKANAALPFWHLQSDGFWRVAEREVIAGTEGQLTRKGLTRADATGEVNTKAWTALTTKPELAKRVARRLLEKYWPAEVREKVAKRVGVRV